MSSIGAVHLEMVQELEDVGMTWVIFASARQGFKDLSFMTVALRICYGEF
jgi:hypothetical protein